MYSASTVFILIFYLTGISDSSKAVLQNSLFSTYDKTVRPPNSENNFETGVEVFTTIVPYYLVEVRDNEGAATLVIYLFVYWNDPRLSWNPEDFNGTTYFDIEDSNFIWKPKLTFAAILKQEDIMNGLQWLGVSYTGIVQAGHYFRLEQDNMEFAAQDFPFDKLSISIYLITPYSKKSVFLSINNESAVNVENMKMIIDWKYQGFKCAEDERQSVWLKVPVNYTYIWCLLEVQRQPAHYLINFCVPCLMVSVLAVLGIHSASSITTARTSKGKNFYAN